MLLCVGLAVVVTLTKQDLRRAEGSADKLQHLMKIRDQSIQTQQQEIVVMREGTYC